RAAVSAGPDQRLRHPAPGQTTRPVPTRQPILERHLGIHPSRPARPCPRAGLSATFLSPSLPCPKTSLRPGLEVVVVCVIVQYAGRAATWGRRRVPCDG